MAEDGEAPPKEEEPVEEPAAVEEPVEEPAVVEEPVEEPAVVEETGEVVEEPTKEEVPPFDLMSVFWCFDSAAPESLTVEETPPETADAPEEAEAAPEAEPEPAKKRGSFLARMTSRRASTTM